MTINENVGVRDGNSVIEATLHVPNRPLGMVAFAHGAGSSRFSPRNNYVAQVLHQRGIGTLLLDLLTSEEDKVRENRFDIVLLTSRLASAVKWLAADRRARGLPLGLFGASTGSAAALRVASQLPDHVRALVSRGGRPDLAGERDLKRVRAPTLLIVGGDDHHVLQLNELAYALLNCEKRLQVVPGATHLFEEPGRLELVADFATDWFIEWLTIRVPATSTPLI